MKKAWILRSAAAIMIFAMSCAVPRPQAPPRPPGGAPPKPPTPPRPPHGPMAAVQEEQLKDITIAYPHR
jgi:hypothetical protein